MYRYHAAEPGRPYRIPHACGGVPFHGYFSLLNFLYSPRMWGCTSVDMDGIKTPGVFPTHVGVYRIYRLVLSVLTVFPTHVGVYRTGIQG